MWCFTTVAWYACVASRHSSNVSYAAGGTYVSNTRFCNACRRSRCVQSSAGQRSGAQNAASCGTACAPNSVTKRARRGTVAHSFGKSRSSPQYHPK